MPQGKRTVPIVPAPERNDEQVHVLEVEEAQPSRLPMILGLVGLLVVGGAGAYLWLNPSVLEGLGGKTVALAPPPAEGNLLGDAWSFETTEAGSASQDWVVPPEAPAGFEFLASGAVSGELGAVARPGSAADGAGWCRMLAERAVPLGVHRGAVELSGTSTGEDLQLLLRFEGPQRAPIDVVVASGRGHISGKATVPPGSVTVRAGIGCVGEGAVDDLELRFVESAGSSTVEQRGTFTVLWLNPGLLVFRGDELVFQIHGMSAKDARGGYPPPSSQWMPSQQSLVLPGGAAIARSAERGGDDRRVTVRETLSGIPEGSTLVRTALVHGSLAELPVGVISSRGYEQFTGDFKVEGVLSLVLGRTQDRLALELGEAATLAGTWQADGSIVLRVELPASGTLSHDLALQTSFQEERVAAAQHRDAALAAEKAGHLGEALNEVAIVATKYPHDEQVNAEAAALRSRVQVLLQERLDKIDRELEDALFLASAARCREVLAEAEAAAATFAGSEAEAKFKERAATVSSRAAQLLAEDEQRRLDRLNAVLASFEKAGGYPSVVAELKEYLNR